MKETVWEGVFRGEPTRIVAESNGEYTSYEIQLVTEGFLTDLAKGATSFAKAHPYITGFMAGWAWDAVKEYNKAKKNAIRFYAKDLPERTKYSKMVDELVRKQGYHVVKKGYKGTGYEWHLQKRTW